MEACLQDLQVKATVTLTCWIVLPVRKASRACGRASCRPPLRTCDSPHTRRPATAQADRIRETDARHRLGAVPGGLAEAATRHTARNALCVEPREPSSPNLSYS